MDRRPRAYRIPNFPQPEVPQSASAKALYAHKFEKTIAQLMEQLPEGIEETTTLPVDIDDVLNALVVTTGRFVIEGLRNPVPGIRFVLPYSEDPSREPRYEALSSALEKAEADSQSPLRRALSQRGIKIAHVVLAPGEKRAQREREYHF